MPTYEYICPQCGVFEEFHGINSSLTSCPTCSREVRRLISRNNNVIFKGSGFHITDYRSKDYSQKASTENSAGGSGASSTSATPEKSQASDAKAAPAQNKAS
ncbi:MAG: zinc ribbon domain-containing protein [Firmicutes bacterium]|nr:zinc ribbon domain-containing protein [Bacillota bacterium]